MDNNLLKIGEMAEHNRITISALRLYDKEGLLKPCYTDPETNYRYYSIRQNARLDMIIYMKELGMSLAEIREILDQQDIQQIEDTLIRKKRQVKEEMRQLELRLDAITRTIESVDRFRKAPDTGMITVEYIPHRYIYYMPTEVNFYEYDISMYEKLLSGLKEKLLSQNLPQIYFCNAGTILKKEDYLEHRYISNEIFIFVDDKFPETSQTRRIDSGMYACIYLNHFEDEIAYADKLLEYCEAHHYTICGDYICEVLTEFNVFESDSRSMFLRLQVPLKFR